MKVIAINGSPHQKGNTYHSLHVMEEVFVDQEIEFEILNIGGRAIHGCIGCGKCKQMQNETCSLGADGVDEWLQTLKTADGIVLGSPVYYAGMTGTMKCFLDRVFYVAGVNGSLFARKIGASVAVMRRGGGIATFDSLNHYFSISEMPIASSTYWNTVHGGVPGEVLQDDEGMQTLKNLALNMVWLLKMKEQTKEIIPRPITQKTVRTNFIR